MFWFVCGKNWLLPALIQLKKVFCQFAEVYTNFYLILLRKGFVSFRLSYAVLSIMFLKTVESGPPPQVLREKTQSSKCCQ